MSFTDKEIYLIVKDVFANEGNDPLEVIPIAEGGSQRLFYRVCFGGRSAVLMRYTGECQENNYYAGIARFLREIGVPVPLIFYHDAEGKFLLMEDLGERDLWYYRHESWGMRLKYYMMVLDAAKKLHSYRCECSSITGPPMMDAFGPELYMWEQDYFLENFVLALCRIKLNPSETEVLEKEFALLIERLDDVAPCLVHRDFQSQNIMIHNEKPVLIDFQGMRYGNPFYDLASLLYDPYVSFAEKEREDLLNYYYGLSDARYDPDDFRQMFRLAAVQRLMQALGAYGFLGLKEKKRKFLAFVPAGLSNLIEAVGSIPHLFAVKNLAIRCRAAIEKRG